MFHNKVRFWALNQAQIRITSRPPTKLQKQYTKGRKKKKVRCQYCSDFGGANVATTNQPAAWLLDSGASNHVTNDLQNLTGVMDYAGSESLIIGNGKSLPITHVGTTSISNSHLTLTLPETLYVPSVNNNLLSVAKLCKDNNVLIEFHPLFCLVKDRTTGVVLFRGTNEGDVYCLSKTPNPVLNSANKSVIPMWHCRLGHTAFPITRYVLNLLDIPNKSANQSLCVSCACSKSHKLPFAKSTLTSNQPLDIIYTDVWGPSKTVSSEGYRYYVIFIDHFTKYIWLYPMKNKSDTFEIFKQFKTIVENYFKLKIRAIYSDNGGEYIKMASFLSDNGISHFLTPPHTPQHNGFAERRHRHIVET